MVRSYGTAGATIKLTKVQDSGKGSEPGKRQVVTQGEKRERGKEDKTGRQV